MLSGPTFRCKWYLHSAVDEIILFEDGPADKNTLLLRVVLALSCWGWSDKWLYSLMENGPVFTCGWVPRLNGRDDDAWEDAQDDDGDDSQYDSGNDTWYDAIDDAWDDSIDYSWVHSIDDDARDDARWCSIWCHR